MSDQKARLIADTARGEPRVEGSFIRVHNRGGYFRIRGWGFLVNVTDHPLYGMRLHGHHLGPVWVRVLRP